MSEKTGPTRMTAAVLGSLAALAWNTFFILAWYREGYAAPVSIFITGAAAAPCGWYFGLKVGGAAREGRGILAGLGFGALSGAIVGAVNAAFVTPVAIPLGAGIGLVAGLPCGFLLGLLAKAVRAITGDGRGTEKGAGEARD